MPTPPPPLTNLQLELLKLYARKVPASDLLEIHRLLATYFMEKATTLADQLWNEKGLQEDELLKAYYRTPYGREVDGRE